MCLSSLWAHLLVTQDWSQKGFSCEIRVVCEVFFRQEPLFFSPDSVVSACPCTYHVTNRTRVHLALLGFSYRHQYKTSWPWRPTFQWHASVSSTQNSSRLFTNWHWIILVGSYRRWWTHDKVSTLIHQHIMERLNTTVSSSEYKHKIKVHFCCKKDKRLFRGYRSWHIVDNMVVAHSKNSSAILPFQWLRFFIHVNLQV